MNTCDTCKYWQQTPDAVVDYFGDCSSSKWRFSFYRLSYRPIDVELDEVVVEDDEGWGFYTGPKFGCVHHATKDK